MRNKLLAATAAAAGAIAMAGSASAATYVSYLEYWDDDPNGPTQVSPFGEVVLEELDANTVKVTATLYGGDTWQQSGGNNIFAFNLADDGSTGVTENHSDPDAVYDGATTYTHAPWGTFTDFFSVGKSGKNGRIHPFEFTASNAGGLTFAGVGATFDGGGKLLSTGTGNQFASNAGGWWFMGHIQPLDGQGEENGESINIAARDAFCVAGCGTGVVPEPGTWALMIMGFGGAGAALRYRRRMVAAV